MVGMVVTISPSFSLYRMVVLPAASSPTIRIRISFFAKRRLKSFANDPEKRSQIYIRAEGNRKIYGEKRREEESGDPWNRGHPTRGCGLRFFSFFPLVSLPSSRYEGLLSSEHLRQKWACLRVISMTLTPPITELTREGRSGRYPLWRERLPCARQTSTVSSSHARPFRRPRLLLLRCPSVSLRQLPYSSSSHRAARRPPPTPTATITVL
ncbi:hypothetical protein MUK42_06779 [Musa troglodytarum]|uniref:Uncharacterized protein n=1 Tax=Musa troglodytarum TaxID=320322 RepID=A0A9E7L8M9_9LILI|nr:hypothetical protein MUK42_06779 [Musa troglodytarum]